MAERFDCTWACYVDKYGVDHHDRHDPEPHDAGREDER